MSGDGKKYDLIVVGSGPGGYVAAIRAAQEGLGTALVEKDSLGGVCLNWGCIPSKALLRSAEVYANIRAAKDYGLGAEEASFDWERIVKRSRQVSDRTNRGVRHLMKKNGIEVFDGRGVLRGDGVVDVEGPEDSTRRIQAKNIILATGGHPRSIPGVEIDRERVITSREALTLQQLPGSAVIVGGGAIGVEFAYLFSTFGVDVTVVEMMDRILPLEDEDVSAELEKILRKRKIRILTGSKVEKVEKNGSGLEVVVEGADDDNGGAETMKCDKVLVAVGVEANVEGTGLEQAGVEVEKGFIRVDKSYRTTAEGIWAIGDCIGGVLLAHAASREGIEAVKFITGREGSFLESRLVPSCIYCRPQVASVGLTEKQARDEGLDVSVGRFPFMPLGKALAQGERDGFVKVVSDKGSGKVLGVHIIGSEATEMIPEASLAMWLGASAGELHDAVHPHPTLSEALMEAALDSVGQAIHI